MDVKLDYCILDTTINGKKEYIAYVVFPNQEKLDPSIVEDRHFPEISSIFKKHGFEHILFMTMKSRNGESVDLKSLSNDLKQHGFQKNLKLKKAMEKQMTVLKNNRKQIYVPSDNKSMTSYPVFYKSDQSYLLPSISSSSEVSSIGEKNTPTVYKKIEPVEIGKKVNLCFYLFMRNISNPSRLIEFDFEYDIYSRKSDRIRHFIKIMKCQFIRKESHLSGIVLESTKTFKELIKELDYMYTISMEDPYNMSIPNKTHQMINFSAIEFKDFIDLDKKIVFHLENDSEYSQLISISNSIKKEKEDYDKLTLVPTFVLKNASQILLKTLEERMIFWSDKEEYELAASYQKSVGFLKTRIELATEMEKGGLEIIDVEDYSKQFSMLEFKF